MTDFLKMKTTVEVEMGKALKLNDLRCEVSKQFASETPQHRNHIRQTLHDQLALNSTENCIGVMDLRQPPRPLTTAVSISHCPTLGGFVFHPKSEVVQSLGFDIEISDRVTPAVAKKVLPHPSEESLRERLDRGDSVVSGIFWAAKESAIKCIGNFVADNQIGQQMDQQIYYGNLTLTDFEELKSGSEYHFVAAAIEFPTLRARGIVRRTDQWIVALATSYSLPIKLEQ